MRLPTGFGTAVVLLRSGSDPVSVRGLVNLNSVLEEGDSQYSAITLRLPATDSLGHGDRVQIDNVTYRVTRTIPGNDPGWVRYQLAA